MSTNPMQQIADLKAQNATLVAENEKLRANGNGNGNGHLDLEKLIEKLVSKEFDRFGRLFREDYTGKIAGMITPYIESTVRRCKETEERQTKLEEQEQKLEKQIAGHQATVRKELEETEKKQLGILNRFIVSLNQHHEINAASLAEQKSAAKDCRKAITETAKAAALCTTFAENYENTASHATGAIKTLAATGRNELQSFLKDIKEEARGTIMPVMKKAREMTEEQYLRRAKWMAFGAVIILMICGVITWFAQPSPYIMRDAASWRTFESELTPDQGNRINKVLNEIHAEQRAEEEKKNK